jgi:hypothetical protein
MWLGPNLALAVLDVSESGVRLIQKTALALGQEVSLTLDHKARNCTIKRLGRVIWSVALADGTFATGISFEKYVEFADLQRLT